MACCRMDSADDPNSDAKPASAGGWYQRTRTLLAHLWTFGTRTIVLVISVASFFLLAIPLYSAVFDRSFVIGEFSVPDELQKRGVTSAVVGRLFFDRIAEMQRVARSAVTQSQLDSQTFGSEAATANVTDIKLPGADVSLTALVSQIRALVGPKNTRIVGEIIKNEGETGYKLRAHASGGENWVEDKDGTDVEALIKEIAGRLVERFDPLVAAFYYFRTPKDDKLKLDPSGDPPESNIDRAINFADGFHSQDKRQQSWALLLRGLAWREKGNPEETRASLCAAIDLDASFIPAWRILASSLREDGAVGQAAYLARRLVRTQPNEPEGYRQLGSLRSNCMAGDAERTKAVGFFTRALELERRQRKPDHLSGVDYAQFLYAWYQPVPVPSQRSKEFVDYMNLAENYLRKAETYTPGEPSVYTTLARILTHPQDEVSTEPQPALSESELKARYASIQSRLLEAELKAKYGLVLDSTSSVANLTMGEVLTDQAAELRNRLLQTRKSDLDEIPDEPTARDKFTKARKSLEEARAHGADSTSLSDALYARALTGAGEFALAEKVLDEADEDDSHVVEWVWGEMLYNQKRYSEAHAHLTKAQNLRSCGPRSNAVRNLLARIEAQSGKEHSATPERASTNVSKKISNAAAPIGAEQVKALSEVKPACPSWNEPENEEPSP